MSSGRAWRIASAISTSSYCMYAWTFRRSSSK
ncbi:hypothetical protein A2U01_0112744, partial [Trifolium medium]|nr:hypothetical protein [Trifolium medium]